MNPAHTWTWRFAVLSGLALLVVSGVLVATGHFPWLSLRSGGVSHVAPETGGDVAIEAMLTADQAARVRNLVKQMMNPPEATLALAQLRDHVESLIKQGSPTASPSMALFVECLAPQFASMDTQTRLLSLALLSDIFGWFGQNSTTCWTALLSPSKGVLSAGLSDASTDVTLAALQFIRACWEWAPSEVDEPAQRRALGTWKAELHGRCVELLRTGDDRVRAAAGVTVVSVPIVSAAERGLVLLHDESPVVRRAMLLALSDRPELLSSEDAVAFLRDQSPAVRSSANTVLTSRGITSEQVALATRATDPSPLVRAQAPRHIVESTAVDRVVWLAHLSRDMAATVRSEAARALAMVGDPECVARLNEMAEADPDPNVRRLAQDLLRTGSQATSRSTAEAETSQPQTLPALKPPKAN